MAHVFALALLALATPAWAECPDYAAELERLRELEPAATKGALTDDEKACLEAAYLKTKEQTAKNKISRVQLVNAYAYSTTAWADLMRRHLEEVDRSDPDLAYLWAFYQFNTDAAVNSEEVVRWTEIGLERRDVWTGDVFVSRVFGLMKLRAIAQNARWTALEEERAKRAADPKKDAEVEEQRNRTKVFAREWVDFARVSGRDPADALALCLSAATQAKACGVDE